MLVSTSWKNTNKKRQRFPMLSHSDTQTMQSLTNKPLLSFVATPGKIRVHSVIP